MAWRAQFPNSAQLQKIEESLEYGLQHSQGLSPKLFDELEGLLKTRRIRLRQMKERARFWRIPLFGKGLELNPTALGLEVLLDQNLALKSAHNEPQRLLRVQAKLEEQWLTIAAALVHEGTHSLDGISWNRRSDERSAYEAECLLLSNVYRAAQHPLVLNTARNLHADAVRDAFECEGLRLPTLSEER